MKAKLTILSVFLAAIGCLTGEIIVNDFFSFEGFVDTSYTYLDKEKDPAGASNINGTDQAFSLEEVEIILLLDFDPFSARMDVEYEDGDNEIDIEQAYIHFRPETFLEGSAVTAGRYASMLGFEAYEPTRMYQYSNAYGGILGELIGGALSSAASNPGVTGDSDVAVFYDSILLPVSERYSQGIKYTFEDTNNFFGISIQDSTVSYDNRLRGDDGLDDMAVDDEGYGLEIAYAYNLMRIVTFFLGGAYEIGEGIDSHGTSVGDTQSYVFNGYVTCQLGAWLFATEVNFSETEMDNFFGSGVDAEVESVTSLIMANYAYNEKASVTGRISYTELDADGGTGGSMSDGHTLKYTLAHNYAFLDELFFVTEFSYLDGKFDTVADPSSDLEEIFLAAEILFMF